LRTFYLVTYDISDPKRLRRVHRAMRGFGDALQYSVFACRLSPGELIVMKEKLGIMIHSREDSVLIANLGIVDGRGGRAVSYLGRRPVGLEQQDRLAVIV